jgi:hypothetical protein
MTFITTRLSANKVLSELDEWKLGGTYANLFTKKEIDHLILIHLFFILFVQLVNPLSQSSFRSFHNDLPKGRMGMDGQGDIF